jgi:hypothetical protein
LRTEDALENKPISLQLVALCNTMMTDGIKNKRKKGQVQVMDIAELIANAAGFVNKIAINK